MSGDKKNKKAGGHNGGLKHLDMDAVGAGSSMDCTGLIPAAPKSRDEREAYKEIKDYMNEPRR